MLIFLKIPLDRRMDQCQYRRIFLEPIFFSLFPDSTVVETLAAAAVEGAC